MGEFDDVVEHHRSPHARRGPHEARIPSAGGLLVAPSECGLLVAAILVVSVGLAVPVILPRVAVLVKVVELSVEVRVNPPRLPRIDLV